MSGGFQLAQVNIGRLKAPVDSPEIREFVENLDRINALAERQPGFVWRLVGEGNNATDVQAFDDPLTAINLSVWDSLDELAAFVYRTAHREIMRRRREWFEAMDLYMALWWIPSGHRPTPAEASARLEILGRRGPTSEAFTFRMPFPPPDALERPVSILDECA
jgi:hypothetical protein